MSWRERRDELASRSRRAAARLARALRAWALRALDTVRRWSRKRPARVLGRDALAAGVLTTLAVTLGHVGFERVEVGTVGVRQIDWGPSSGIVQRDYPPGIYLAPSPWTTWHRLDSRTHVASFSWESEGGQSSVLPVRTLQGDTVDVALSVPYRIRPGAAYRLVEDGLKQGWHKRVRDTIVRVLVQELGQLSTEDFADTDRRLAVADGALAALREALAELHVEADGVFVSGAYFSPTYEKKKQEEQLQQQTIRTNEVLARLREKRLDNELVELGIEEQRKDRLAQKDRELGEEGRKAQETLADQQLANQALEARLARECAELEHALALELAAEQRTHAAALADLAAERSAVEQAQALERQAVEVELEVAFDEARAAAEAAVEARRLAVELAAGELLAAERALTLELDGALEEERLEHGAARAAVEREAAHYAGERALAAEVEHARLAREGGAALELARAEEDRLQAEAYATPAGRLLLARRAARNLNFRRVALDARDPRVPSLFDLDALVALLVGE